MPWTLIIAVALMVVSAAITALTAKKPSSTTPDPSKISDFNFPTIDEGTAQSVVFGDVWVDDWFVLWYGNLRTAGIPAKNTGGGKK